MTYVLLRKNQIRRYATDFKLDTDAWDLALVDDDGNGRDIVMAVGVDLLVQRLKYRLQSIKGEWFLTTSYGLPYYEYILKKPFDKLVATHQFKKMILNTPGVDQLLQFDLRLNRATRRLQVWFTVLSGTDIVEVVV